MLQDIGNLAQALAAFIAVIGIPLAVRQLRMQNRMSRVEVTRDLESKWSSRLDRVRAKENVGQPILSIESINFVGNAFAMMNARVAFPADGHEYSFPRVLMLISPDMKSVMRQPGALEVPMGGPTNEGEYRDVLIRRCRLIFPVLDELKSSSSVKHRNDIQEVIQLTYSLAASISDVAEMFDFGLADPEQFMDKRHLAVVRDLHVLEPFLIWQAIRLGDHRSVRGLRALALGGQRGTYLVDRSSRTCEHGHEVGCSESLGGCILWPPSGMRNDAEITASTPAPHAPSHGDLTPIS